MILERSLPTTRDPRIFINILIIVGVGASKVSESHRTTFFPLQIDEAQALPRKKYEMIYEKIEIFKSKK